jgi:hypothetical protein
VASEASSINHRQLQDEKRDRVMRDNQVVRLPWVTLSRTSRRQGAPILDDRSSAIVDEWIRLVEIPASSGKEQARAEYIRAGTCFTPSVRDLTGQL